MPIYRLNSSGVLKRITGLYRLNDAGVLKKIANAYRLNDAGVFKRIFVSLIVPTVKTANPPLLYFVDSSSNTTSSQSISAATSSNLTSPATYDSDRIYLTRGRWNEEPLSFIMSIQKSQSANFTSGVSAVNSFANQIERSYTTYQDSDGTDQVPLISTNRYQITKADVRNGFYFRGYIEATNQLGLMGQYSTDVILPRMYANIAFNVASAGPPISYIFNPQTNGGTFTWSYSGNSTIQAQDIDQQEFLVYPLNNTSGSALYSTTIFPGTGTSTPTTTVTFTSINLSPNTQYTAVIRSTMKDGWSNNSNVSLRTIVTDQRNFFTAAAIPDIPTNVTGSDVGTNRPYNNGAVSLSWTQPGTIAATGYKIEYTPGPLYAFYSVLVANTGSSTTSGTFTGLDSGVSYKFTVSAINAQGTSNASADSNIVAITTVPIAPTNVSAIAGDASADVSYTASTSNGGKSITDYRATSSPGGITGSENISPITVTGLTNYTNYTFTVAARNANGYSAESTASAAVMPKLPAPVGSGTVTIAADSPSNYIFKITSYGTWSNSATTYDYEWQTSPNNSTWTTRASGTDVATIPNYNASSYKTQFIRLRVFGRNLTGPSINPLTSNTLVVFYTTPVINTFTVTGSELLASWSYTYAADDPSATVELEYKLSSASTWTAFLFPTSPGSIGLSPGTYDFRLYVVNSIDGGSRIALSTVSGVVVQGVYSFSFGNTLNPSNNGYIGLGSASSSITIPSTGKYLAVFPGDFLGNTSAATGYMLAWSDSSQYVIRFDGYRVGFFGNSTYRIQWMATFYNGVNYVDVKIITKGSNISGGVLVGIYNNGNLVAGVAPAPYTLSTGTTFRVYFDGTTGSFGVGYDEISITPPNDIMAIAGTKVGSGDDDVYYSVTTAANYYKTPTVTIGTVTSDSYNLYIPYTESNGCDYSTYTIRTGSYAGTIVASGSTSVTPLIVGSLSSNTTYYITFVPYNYKNQAGTTAQVTKTTSLDPPTITYSNVTSSSFTVSWSRPGATSYYIDIYNNVTGISLFGYPTTTTNTSASPFGLTSNNNYTTIAYADNANGRSNAQSSTIKTLFLPLTPTFGSNTRTSGGFDGSVTNYDSNYTWSLSTSAGTVTPTTFSGTGTTKTFSVTGLTAGSSATVTVTTSRSGYDNGSNTTTGQALSNLITNPAYGTATSASGGFSASISTQPNPTAGTYSVVSQTNGTATVNSTSGALTVTGLTAGQSSTVTVRYSLSGYNSVDITASGSATSNVAPFNGTATISLQSGTSGRVGAVFSATGSAQGTPEPSISGYQWQYYIPVSDTWANVPSGGTGSTYSTAFRDTTYTDVGKTFRCRITFSNGVSPDLTVNSSNTLSIDNPTITSVISYYRTTATLNPTTAGGAPKRPPTTDGSSFVVWYVFGYNFQSINSRTVINGSTQASTSTSDSQNIDPLNVGIYRQTAQGANGQTYALRIEPRVFPQGGGFNGTMYVTDTRTLNSTNQTNSPITNSLTVIFSL